MTDEELAALRARTRFVKYIWHPTTQWGYAAKDMESLVTEVERLRARQLTPELTAALDDLADGAEVDYDALVSTVCHAWGKTKAGQP